MHKTIQALPSELDTLPLPTTLFSYRAFKQVWLTACSQSPWYPSFDQWCRLGVGGGSLLCPASQRQYFVCIDPSWRLNRLGAEIWEHRNSITILQRAPLRIFVFQYSKTLPTNMHAHISAWKGSKEVYYNLVETRNRVFQELISTAKCLSYQWDIAGDSAWPYGDTAFRN